MTMRRTRRNAVLWLSRHPTTNLLAWGGTTLVWTLPKKGLTAYHQRAYKQRVTTSGRPLAASVSAGSAASSSTEAVTVESEVISSSPLSGGAQRKSKTTTTKAITKATTKATTTATGGVVHMPDTARVLGRGDLARAWAAIIDQVAAWGPVIDAEATSVAYAAEELELAAGDIAAAIDDIGAMLALGNFDRRVLAQVRTAAISLTDAAAHYRAARQEVNRRHVDQVEQESTGVPMARRPGSVLIAGRGVEQLSVKRSVRAITLHISGFLPEFGEVIASTGSHLMTNKWALALWGQATDELADQLGSCGVDRHVCAKIRAAADDLRGAGISLHAAVQLLGRLYASQAAAETAGATVTPIR